MEHKEQAPQQHTPPTISILEKQTTNGRDLSTIPDYRIKNPLDTSYPERTDNFNLAYNNIVNNAYLENLFMKGLNYSPDAFSEIINYITQYCVSLTDEEIDRITDLFVKNFRKKTLNDQKKFSLTDKQVETLSRGYYTDRNGTQKPMFNSNGIKTVAHFVRARKKLHQTSPETVPAFYFENHLDSAHKIDLIEVVETSEGVVLNLIQLKSKPYANDELEKYHTAHREWINDFTVDLAGYERAMMEQPKDAENIGEFMRDVKAVDEAFINFLIGGKFSKDDLFESLHMGKGRNKAQRVWIVKQYSGLLKQEIQKLLDDGVLLQDEFEKISSVLRDLDLELEEVLKKRKDLSGIKEVYSICAVGEREVSKRLVFRGEGDKRKALKISRPN